MQATYVYDALSNRIEKQVYDGAATTTTRFAYDGSDVWADLNGSSSLTTRYLHGDGIDDLVARITSGGTVSWILADRLGSVRNVVDANGSLIATLVYDAWGKVTSESSAANSGAYGYAGYRRDTETDLYHTLTRSLSPGRWLQEDTIRFNAGDPNLFRYVWNSPTSFVDPSGLMGPVITFRPRNIWPTVKSVGNSVGDAVSQWMVGYTEILWPLPLPNPPPPTTKAGLLGRNLGRGTGTAQAAVELVGGSITAGGATAATVGSGGVAAPVAVPIGVGGAAVAVHGALGISRAIQLGGPYVANQNQGGGGGGGGGGAPNPEDLPAKRPDPPRLKPQGRNPKAPKPNPEPPVPPKEPPGAKPPQQPQPPLKLEDIAPQPPVSPIYDAVRGRSRTANYTEQSRRHVFEHGHAANSPKQPGKSRFRPREGGQAFTDEVINHPNVKVTHQGNGRILYEVDDLGRVVGRDRFDNPARGGAVVVEGPNPQPWSTYAAGEVVTQYPR